MSGRRRPPAPGVSTRWPAPASVPAQPAAAPPGRRTGAAARCRARAARAPDHAGRPQVAGQPRCPPARSGAAAGGRTARRSRRGRRRRPGRAVRAPGRRTGRDHACRGEAGRVQEPVPAAAPARGLAEVAVLPPPGGFRTPAAASTGRRPGVYLPLTWPRPGRSAACLTRGRRTGVRPAPGTRPAPPGRGHCQVSGRSPQGPRGGKQEAAAGQGGLAAWAPACHRRPPWRQSHA
jgi:hypothetical protein